jgi:hypothetical protein
MQRRTLPRTALPASLTAALPAAPLCDARAEPKQYDPQGMFIVLYGVGSEAWSAAGFTRGG